MALKFTIPFPLFSPGNPNPSDHRSSTEVRFSRWNNANAQKIILQERAQKEIEDEIRFHRRFSSADRITEIQSDDGPTSTEDDAPRFKSTGTPSSPSRPSIPGKVSKYSKPPKPDNPHPAFRSVIKTRKLPRPPDEAAAEKRSEARINVSENGLSYVIPGAPFEFQYSYTETPKVKPLKLREAPYTPFGPSTMSRPWTGRAPLPPSKKKLKEFDSFRPPPPNKKGVKPVQAPGPFLRGSGPRYVMSREEILGEPLTREEIKDLILQCIKTKRQLNIGRDGLTHNMLDNIHAHWKRRRVCKIKCKGVCTVDMGNVRQQLEERTGGKIISCKGGVIYLFRGRNYNYKTRPCFPLMLWKPVTPVYPRLVKQAPDGLTHEEADEIRKMGRQLTPICKLGKNGVYCNLVRNVREAFEECEVVRINCQGLNSSDFHKIGAKLRDLVPCVLISFEREHILVWRGREWNSSLERPGDGDEEAKVSETGTLPVSEGQPLQDPEVSSNPVNPDMAATSASIPSTSSESPGMLRIDEAELDEMGCDDDSRATTTGFPWKTVPASGDSDEDDGIPEINGRKPATLSPAMERVETLLKQALEGGSAFMLHRDCLDADIVYARAVNLAKSAPPEPVYPRQPKNKAVKRCEKKDTDDLEVEETAMEPEMKESWREESWRGSLKTKGKMDFRDDYLGVVPQGSLAVDELAKLLA